MSAWLAVVAIQAAVLLAGGLLAAHALRRRAAALRHALWAQVVAAALLIPLVSPLLGEHRIGVGLPAAWWSAPPRATPLPAGPPTLAALPPGWEEEGPATPFERPGRAAGPAGVLALWGVGASLLGARLLRSRLALSRLRRRARPASEPLLLDAAAAAAGAVGCRRRFAVLVHEGIGTPASCGVLRPAVLLPAAWAAWPPERLRAVLLHELAHVAGRHALPQLLSELLCVMHWFDPLAWLAARRLVRERERACDDAVLRAGLPARSYATELVAVASELVERTRPLAAALGLGGARELEARLRAVLDPAQPRSSSRRQHARLLAATATLALLVAALAPPGAAGTRAVDDLGAGIAIAPAPLPEVGAGPSRVVGATGPRRVAGAGGEIESTSGFGEPAVAGARELASEAARRAPRSTISAPTAAADAPGDDPYADPLTEVVPATLRSRALPAAAGPEAESIRRLLAAAQHTKSWEGDLVRERAEWALAQVRDGEVVRPLTAALSADDWRVKAYAAWSLAVTGDRRAAAAIEPLVDHPVWRVRAQAVFSLLQLGAELPAERVAALAGDPAWQVRIGVVEHAERQGGDGAEAVLRRLAADPHGGTRLRAADALRALAGASG